MQLIVFFQGPTTTAGQSDDTPESMSFGRFFQILPNDRRNEVGGAAFQETSRLAGNKRRTRPPRVTELCCHVGGERHSESRDHPAVALWIWYADGSTAGGRPNNLSLRKGLLP